MKILFVITELGPGGAERVVLNLASGYAGQNHSVSVVSLCPPPAEGTISAALRKAGVHVIFLDGERRFFHLARQLKQVVRKIQPDLVHSHLMHANLIARAALFRTGIPLVNTIHIAERRHGKFMQFLLDRMTFRLADAVTAVSHAAANWHAGRIHRKPSEIKVIYNGSDPVVPVSQAQGSMLLKEWGVDSCSKIIGSIGRLNLQKGYDLLLSRLTSLSERVPEGETWGIVILGEGPQRAELEEIRHADHFPRLKVVLPGYYPDASSMMALFDAFVMPSRYEGYGLALTEAFSLGLPVVCSRADSLPELCKLYTGSSWLVDFDEDEAGIDLADKLAAAVSTQRALPCIIMTNEQMCQSYLSLYQSLVKNITGA